MWHTRWRGRLCSHIDAALEGSILMLQREMRLDMRTLFFAFAAVAFALPALPQAVSQKGDWPAYGHDPGGMAASRRSEIRMAIFFHGHRYGRNDQQNQSCRPEITVGLASMPRPMVPLLPQEPIERHLLFYPRGKRTPKPKNANEYFESSGKRWLAAQEQHQFVGINEMVPNKAGDTQIKVK